jgi:peroxiredoxin Q/BCP
MRLQPGDPAPGFTRSDQDGQTVSLADYAGRPLVVFFYPRAFTPGCTTESCDFRDRHERFTAAGYAVLGVSPDPVERLERFRREHALPFTLLSDEDHAMAEDYGAWGIKTNYGRQSEGLIRSTFTIGPDGRIEHAWYAVRAKGHAARVEAALDA